MYEVLMILTVLMFIISLCMVLFKFSINRYCSYVNKRIEMNQTTKQDKFNSHLFVCIIRLLFTRNSVSVRELPRVLKHLSRLDNLSVVVDKYITYSWIVTGWFFTIVAVFIFIDGYN